MAVSHWFRNWRVKRMGPIPGGTQYPPGPAGVFLTRPHKRYGNLPGGPCAKRCARLARLGLDAHLLEYTAVSPEPANAFFQDIFKVRFVFYISPPKHQRSWGQVIERTRCCHMCIYEGSVYIYIYICSPIRFICRGSHGVGKGP